MINITKYSLELRKTTSCYCVHYQTCWIHSLKKAFKDLTLVNFLLAPVLPHTAPPSPGRVLVRRSCMMAFIIVSTSSRSMCSLRLATRSLGERKNLLSKRLGGERGVHLGGERGRSSRGKMLECDFGQYLIRHNNHLCVLQYKVLENI